MNDLSVVDEVDPGWEVDPNPELVEEFAVYGLPTIALFKDGKMVEGSKREGAINLPKLKDHLASFGLPAP